MIRPIPTSSVPYKETVSSYAKRAIDVCEELREEFRILLPMTERTSVVYQYKKIVSKEQELKELIKYIEKSIN